MFEKLKNLDFKSIMKFFGIAFIGIIFIIIVISLFSMLLKILFGGGFNTFSGGTNSSYTERYSQDSLAKSSGINFESSPAVSTQDSMNYTESNVPSNVAKGDYDVKSYSVIIDSNNVSKDCKNLINGLKKDYIKKDSIYENKHYCNLNIKVLKGKEETFISFLKTFNLKDLSTNISNIVKNYTDISDKISETEKNLKDTEEQLSQTKSSYDELWNSLKNKNISVESIDALNKIILNKAELISKFSKEREQNKELLTMYKKQKQDYDEQIRYIDFFITVNEKIIVDWENIKLGWHNDYKEMVGTFNDTVKNLSVNLISFVLKTVNVVIYVVLILFITLVGGKGLYKMGRKILYTKDKSK